MTRPTEPILTRAMVAFDVALAAAALALTVLLADRMSIWIAIPVALATLVTALVLSCAIASLVSALSAVVVTNNDPAKARALTQRLLDAAWGAREAFLFDTEPLAESVARATVPRPMRPRPHHQGVIYSRIIPFRRSVRLKRSPQVFRIKPTADRHHRGPDILQISS